MKKLLILFVTLLLICVIQMSSVISIYAYYEEENTTTDETIVVTEEESGTYSSRSTIIEGGGEINGELWYAIELDNDGNPIITYDIDYSDSHLLEYLKPGDIVYERNAGFDMVDFLGHIAMVIEVVQDTPTQQGYVLMIESLPNLIPNPYTGEPRELGVCYSIMTPTRFDVKHVSVMRVKDATDEQIQGAINWAKSQHNQSWRVPVNKFVDNDDPDKDWYCSELVWAAYYQQNIHLAADNILPVAPKDIYERDEVSTILDYSSPTTFSEVTATHHTYSCDGDTYTEAHEFEAYNYCYEKCRICDYVRPVQTHDYTYRYESMNELTHYGYCECGAKREFNHNFTVSGILDICVNCKLSKDHVHSYTYLSAMDGKMHRKMCSCGISQLELCLGITFPGSTTSCVKCGQVLNGGTVTPFGDNDEVVLFNKEGYLEETE